MRIVWLVGALGALLITGVAWMVSSAMRNDTPMEIPDHGVEGVATHRLRWVEVGWRARSSGRSWHTRPLLTEVQGERRFQVGDVAFRVEDPLLQLKNWTIRSKTYDSLTGVPESARIPGWEKHDGPGGFYVSELVVEPGEAITLELSDGAPVALWRGSLEDLRRRRAQMASQGVSLARFMLGFGALTLVIALFCFYRVFTLTTK